MKKYFALFTEKCLKVSISYGTIMDFVSKNDINNYEIKEVTYSNYLYLKNKLAYEKLRNNN